MASINASRGVLGLPLFDPDMLMKEQRFHFDFGYKTPEEPGYAKEEKTYLAGPMRGKPNFNYDVFSEVADDLRGDGIQIENPADHFDGDQTRTFAEYMQAAFLSLMTCDSIALLPGWEDSEGAQLEASVAKALGLRFFLAGQDHGPGHSWYLVESAPPISVSKPAGPETIDAEARRLVFRGARQEDYGHPRGDFDRIAKIWSGILGIEVSAEQVAICMIGLKLGRLSHTPQHHDSKVDVIGYALCLDRLSDPADS